MPSSKLALAMLALHLASAGPAAADGCRECTRGPANTACTPNGGILLFNSVPPNVPAYWTLFATTRGIASLRRLDGELAVWSDSPDPHVPGFPGRLEGDVYLGEAAPFSGLVRRNRLLGMAHYASGASCRFRAALAFGFGGTRPNRFVCRGPSGELLSHGRVQVQGIRLRGCRRR